MQRKRFRYFGWKGNRVKIPDYPRSCKFQAPPTSPASIPLRGLSPKRERQRKIDFGKFLKRLNILNNTQSTVPPMSGDGKEVQRWSKSENLPIHLISMLSRKGLRIYKTAFHFIISITSIYSDSTLAKNPFYQWYWGFSA